MDRASKFTILLHVPGPRYSAEAVADSLVAALEQLPPRLRRSLTWDQGSEIALHAGVSRALGMPVFFFAPAEVLGWHIGPVGPGAPAIGALYPYANDSGVVRSQAIYDPARLKPTDSALGALGPS